jgi:uncharacterized protein YdeI (YjbR/CyaY-like superfamily)
MRAQGSLEVSALKGPGKAKNLPLMAFEDQQAWADWLHTNHATSSGLWIRLAKKTSARRSVSYAEAVEVALCYGWIDGQSKRYNETSWLQKFTPRRSRSIWSKTNREKAERLISQGRMQPAGLAEMDRAKQDGRWDAAYDSPRVAMVPAEFQAALERNPRASTFFRTLNSRDRFAILFRIQTARTPATRTRRIERFIRMLANHEKIYP